MNTGLYIMCLKCSPNIPLDDCEKFAEILCGFTERPVDFTLTRYNTHSLLSLSIGEPETHSLSAFLAAWRATWFWVALPPLNWRYVRMEELPEWTSQRTFNVMSHRKHLGRRDFRKEFCLPHTLKRRQAKPFMLAHEKANVWREFIATIHRTHERTYYG